MLNKIKAVMVGHAIGDAIGVPVEFCNRDYLNENPIKDMVGFGTHNVPAGCWSDDTSMSLCALDSLAKGIVDYDDIMNNFCEWYYHDKFTCTGFLFDVGNTCADAISTYYELRYPTEKCGLRNEMSNGNGSLMRIHPFVLYGYCNGVEDEDVFSNMITAASSLTHAHQCSVDGCIIYTYVLLELLNNPSKESIYKGLRQAKTKINASTVYYSKLLHTQDIKMWSMKDIKSGGYIVDTLEAALWCLLTTNNYKECVLKAVNLGGDTDTIAAIAGGLAGALYGLESIPQIWLNTIKNRDYIESMCEKAYKKWSETNELQSM